MTREETIILLDVIRKILLKNASWDESTHEPINQSFDMAIEALENQKIGHWRHYEGMLMCSECGTEFYDDIMEYCGDDVPKCCPNCGAKMEGENNE